MRSLLTLTTLVIMVAASVALYRWSQPEALNPSAPEAQPEPARESKPSAVAPPPLPQPKTISVPAQTPPMPSEPGSSTVIDFQVVDGLAIAYGDVLLGKVEDGASQSRGRYEAPVPRTWERPEIPYAINPDLPNPARVEQAIAYFSQNTPVKFVPYQGQPDAIVFEAGTEHCYSYLGKSGGHQPIKLAQGCQTQEIMHEMMHALGFIHEHSRTDRDQHIEVLWTNIDEQFKPQFFLAPEAFMEPVRGLPFDFRSIMLYEAETFAHAPGQKALRSRGSVAIAPARTGLSPLDIEKLRRLFRVGE